MSAIRTFTVTAAGGKYYIDGVLQDTVNLAEGYTYIFNYPSAHPFKFSTTSFIHFLNLLASKIPCLYVKFKVILS